MKHLFFLVLILFGSLATMAQDTTAQEKGPRKAKERKEKKHSPGGAALRSAIIPGWGQAYNKKYWKIPIIYAGIAGIVYAIDYNAGNYTDFRDAYIARTDNDATTVDIYENIYTEDQLLTIIDFYRKNLDLSVVGGTLLYVANIIDATVDAHLMEFNISDDLSLRIEPKVIFAGGRPAQGIGLRLGL